MCGIAGMFDTRGRRDVPRGLVERMSAVLSHRGPDAAGFHFEPGVGLAHRRLSIIDLEGGVQPLFNEDGTVAVVFNGEIYNFQALAAELRALGHVFRTHSDTEVIVHAWEEWGEDCVTRFRGMFAFALWDRRRGEFFLARDRLGVKPLFYSLLPDGMLAFGSELKAIMQCPALSRDIDPQCVEDYFALGYVPDPRTIFSNVLRLPPAHTLLLRAGQPMTAPHPYWDVNFDPDPRMTEQDAIGGILARLTESVRLRMIADVPLGAFLSGGVDSSAVVATMAGLSDSPVVTCSMSFDDPAFDETSYAGMVARRYRTAHHVEQVASDDFDLLDTLTDLYDEPYADSSAIPTWRVCRLARMHVTVALSGDGADESLGGYRRHRLHLMEERMRRALPMGVRRPVFGALGRWYPKADWAPRGLRAKTSFQAMARTSVEAYFHSVSVLRDEQRSALFSDEFRRRLAGYNGIEVFHRYAADAQTDDALSLVQYLDLKTYLPGDINTKVDRASMAHSLEVREPLMDHELVQWLARVPSDLKVRGGVGKYVFKRALEPMLPRELLYRPKMGFAVPLARWFRGPLRERVREGLLGSRLAETGLFAPHTLRTWVDAHQSGRHDYSAPIWSLLMFESFLRRQGVGGVA